MLLVVAVIAMGTTWMLVARLNAASSDVAIAKRAHNAKVLAQAKQALIGYVAAQANKAGENNPGNLPCPENAGNFDNAYEDQGLVGTNCGTIKVGRFPWRTLGLDKLVDADGEPLWYAVSPNWGYSIGATTLINSGTTGELTVDGAANAAIAVIIAPGAAINAQEASGCTAWSQTRPTSGTPDVRNYLECQNAITDTTFVTTGPSGSFNDQVLVVTAADMLPSLEAAIANRIEREIAPVVRDAFLNSAWGLGSMERIFPYAASFADPANTATAFRGEPTGPVRQGLLPLNFGDACNPSTEPRCALMAFSPSSPPSAYKQSGFGFVRQTDPSNTLPWGTTVPCQWDSTDGGAVLCEGEYRQDDTNLTGTMRIEVSATLTNVATGLRALHAKVEARDDVTLGPWNAMAHSVATTMNADGSATITVGATLPNIDCPTGGTPPCANDWGTYAQYRIRLKVADHPLVATRPREVNFDSGSAAEIRPGQTVRGQNTGAIGRVSRVTLDGGTAWDTASANPAITTTPARGTLTFYSVAGAFRSGENLEVLQGATGVVRARATGTDSDADIDMSWFARNEWYRHVYYAVADNYVWTGGGSCSDTSPVTCLQVSNTPVAADATRQRAILFLMGRALDGQSRPSVALTDYLDSAENRNGDGVFERLTAGRTFNDRFVSISKN